MRTFVDQLQQLRNDNADTRIFLHTKIDSLERSVITSRLESAVARAPLAAAAQSAYDRF